MESNSAAAEDMERSVNEWLAQTLSRINVLEAQKKVRVYDWCCYKTLGWSYEPTKSPFYYGLEYTLFWYSGEKQGYGVLLHRIWWSFHGGLPYYWKLIVYKLY